MKNKKTKTISLRCTEEEFDRICSKAAKQKQSITDFLLDDKLPSRYRSSRIKRSIPHYVHLQESINILNRYLKDSPTTDTTIIKEIDNISKEVTELWEN